MFKDSFKFYKAKWPVPDFKDVLDFDQINDEDVLQLKPTLPPGFVPISGLLPVKKWKCYELKGRPGLIFIKNPFTGRGQRYWMTRCIKDYTKHPNKVNLSTKMFDEATVRDWWTSLQAIKDKSPAKKLKTAMRWSTLGYHHDWDTKVYTETSKNDFPEDLKLLTLYFAQVVGYRSYSAEAAIVNFYPIGTTLAGHTDHSETNLEAPLFSFSFGQTAIFLIGGPTREEKPTAMFLKSGDVAIMSKESRLCYHAVPRVMKADWEPWNSLEDYEENHANPPEAKKVKTDEDEVVELKLDEEVWEKCQQENYWRSYREYLEDSRININIRQVLKDGQTCL